MRPRQRRQPSASRITVSGNDAPVSGAAVTSLALLLHEFATNAAKYGALSSPEGTIAIRCFDDGADLVVTWTERGGPPVVEPHGAEGFGGVLSRLAVAGQLGGEIGREWRPEGARDPPRLAAIPPDRLKPVQSAPRNRSRGAGRGEGSSGSRPDNVTS